MISTLDLVNEVHFLVEFLQSRQITGACNGVFSQPPLKYSARSHYCDSLNFNRGDFVKMFFPLVKAEMLDVLSESCDSWRFKK